MTGDLIQLLREVTKELQMQNKYKVRFEAKSSGKLRLFEEYVVADSFMDALEIGVDVAMTKAYEHFGNDAHIDMLVKELILVT